MLKDVYLSLRFKEHGVYKDEYISLQMDLVETGMTLHLREDPGEGENECLQEKLI